MYRYKLVVTFEGAPDQTFLVDARTKDDAIKKISPCVKGLINSGYATGASVLYANIIMQ